MARKWTEAGPANADGLSMVVARQKVGDKDGQPVYQAITYGVYGVVKVGSEYTLGKDSAKLALMAKNKLAAKGGPEADAALMDCYENEVYGLDLQTRQAEKPGGSAEPRANLGKEEEVDLVTGKVYAKAGGAEVAGRVVSLEERISYINDTLGHFARSGRTAPRAFTAAAETLTEQKLVRSEAGRLVIAKGNGAPRK